MTTEEILKELNYDSKFPEADEHISGKLAKAIDAKLRAAEELATEVSKLADYWGKTCDVMLALENYRKVGEDK